MSPLSTPFQYHTEVLANAIRQEKEIKGIEIEDEKTRLSSFTYESISYVGNLKELTKKKRKSWIIGPGRQENIRFVNTSCSSRS